VTNLQTYTGNHVWRGPDIAESSKWAHTFTSQEIKTLKDAADAVIDREIVSLGSDDFDLCELDTVLQGCRAELTDGYGFVLLRGLPVADWPVARTARVYWAICSRIGLPIAQNPVGNLLGHVIDVGGDSAHPHQRAHQSSDNLPFHTDIGAEIASLLCLHNARSGGESHLVSSSALWNKLVATRPDLAETLTHPFHLDRRGEVIEGQEPCFVMPAFIPTADRILSCYNPRFVHSAQRFKQVPRLTHSQVEALDTVMALANEEKFKLKMDFCPGDIQLINNFQLLHSRSEYKDWPEPDRRRHLWRVWLCVPGGKPIPDALYARFGADEETGRPQGTNLPPGIKFTAPLDPPALRT
jgi:hypothetical protein